MFIGNATMLDKRLCVILGTRTTASALPPRMGYNPSEAPPPLDQRKSQVNAKLILFILSIAVHSQLPVRELESPPCM